MDYEFLLPYFFMNICMTFFFLKFVEGLFGICPARAAADIQDC